MGSWNKGVWCSFDFFLCTARCWAQMRTCGVFAVSGRAGSSYRAKFQILFVFLVDAVLRRYEHSRFVHR